MPLTIAQLMEKMPGAFLPEKAPGLDAVIHFKFSGEEPGEWNAVIKDGKCAVNQAAIEGDTSFPIEILKTTELFKSCLLEMNLQVAVITPAHFISEQYL